MTKKMKILNLVLLIFVLGQSVLLVYTNVVDKEDSDINEAVENNKVSDMDESVKDNDEHKSQDDVSDDNSVKYTLSDVSEKVYISTDGPYYLILWNDGTYSYTNDKYDDETMGSYTVVGDELRLNYVFAIDRGSNTTSSVDDTAVLTEGEKVLKINSLYEIFDEENNVKLNSVNQPACEGGRSFYTELKGLLN